MAQDHTDYHSDRAGAANGASTAARLSDGDMVISFRYRGAYQVRGITLPNASDFGVALIRLSPSGSVRWAKDVRAERSRVESVSSIHALPGGAFALNVQQSGTVLGHISHAALIRVRGDGQFEFSFADPSPSASLSMFQVVAAESGDLLVAGLFKDGAYAVTPHRVFQHDHVFAGDAGHFLARVDGDTGQVHWARPVPDRLDLRYIAVLGDRILVAAKHPDQGSAVSRPIELFTFSERDGEQLGHATYRRRHRTWIHGLVAYRDGFALLMAECGRQPNGLCGFPSEAVLLAPSLEAQSVHSMGIRGRFLPGPPSDHLRVIDVPDEEGYLSTEFRIHTLRVGDSPQTRVYRPSESFFRRSLHGASYADEFVIGLVAEDQRATIVRSRQNDLRLAFGPARSTEPPRAHRMSEEELDQAYGAAFGADAARTRQEQRETLRREGVPAAILRQMGLTSARN